MRGGDVMRSSSGILEPLLWDLAYDAILRTALSPGTEVVLRGWHTYARGGRRLGERGWEHVARMKCGAPRTGVVSLQNGMYVLS